jgi:amidophosphoribosyltransferase
MGGLIGNGDAFVLRDPSGIRPAYYYEDEEVVVVCSERPIIQTVFNVSFEQVKELSPGSAALIRRNGSFSELEIIEKTKKLSCSFERIYFSRGNDAEIYEERQNLGKMLVPDVMKALDNDFENTVFSYIPNTAEVAFTGMSQALISYYNKLKVDFLLSEKSRLSQEDLDKILTPQPRLEKLVYKDAKQRTFITDDANRNDLVSQVYDITYGKVRKGIDNLVVLDDSIVRGTTLKQSILKILDRLQPKKIIVVSSAPQIRYPDCYGIDMSVLGNFIAFEAAISLLKEKGKGHILDEVYQKAKLQVTLPKEEQVNVVKEIYSSFSALEISKKIAELLKPNDLNADLEIIYQSIEGLHASCPKNLGDWYFTGDYPTPGGVQVANKSFIHFIEGKISRAY